MDYRSLLKNRRAIREFQDREVPLAIVQEILQDTCLAPTASNGQPCRFVIIRDRGYMKRLSDESKKNLLAEMASNPQSARKQYEEILRDETFNVFYNAPCLVYVIGPRDLSSLEVDCALTAAYFMFSATSRGLGTCWIGLGSHIKDPQLLAEMGMTKDEGIVAPIIVGYPVGIPEASERHAPRIAKVL